MGSEMCIRDRHITACENVFPLPQTKSWLRGMTVQKGFLYSVTDLSLFAGLSQAVEKKRSHLILLNRPSEQVALIVSQLLGFKYLSDARDADPSDCERVLGDLQPFFVNGHRFDGDVFFSMDWGKLMNSSRFLEVQ